MYIYHPNTKMTHKNDGFIENLMKVPAPLNNISLIYPLIILQRVIATIYIIIGRQLYHLVTMSICN